MRTNRDRLVTVAVQGEISHPDTWAPAYDVGYDGVARVLPGTGGITYNVRVGDPALGWAGDHVEPGVSLRAKEKEHNRALNTFACVGNEAVVLSGDAKGRKGVVTGKHGGIEHVLVDFPPDVLQQLSIGDKVLIRACGQGLVIEDLPGVHVVNLDPGLLERMGVRIEAGRLVVPVAHVVPAELMGSGIGATTSARGDYDITTQDRERLAELGLNGLRLGDIVAIRDRAGLFGHQYRRGAVEIGVVIHSDSFVAGHGPGVTTLLTCLGGEIVPETAVDANIAAYLGLR